MYLYALKKEGIYEPLSGPTGNLDELRYKAMAGELTFREQAGQMLADRNLIELQIKYANTVKAIETQLKMMAMFGQDIGEIVIVELSDEHYAQMERALEETIQAMENGLEMLQRMIPTIPGIDGGYLEREFKKACSFAGTQTLAEYETKDGKVLKVVTQEEANAIREEYRTMHALDFECDDDYNCDNCDYDCENCPYEDDCSCDDDDDYYDEDDDYEESDDDEIFAQTFHSSKKQCPDSCIGCIYFNEAIGRCVHPAMRGESDKNNCLLRATLN